MNSFVNVQVRVLAAQAQAQLAALNSRVNAMSGSFGKSAKSAAGFSGVLNGMALDSFGSRVQWAGRQLEYNFTLPIVAAGTAAMKMALDNEAAFTRIQKVYGDATHGADFYSKEVAALRVNFEQLSNSYGVNQAEVLGVAASWAAAGASGVALAKSVDLTMQTMILGEMKAAEATNALISIQAQYGFGVADLTKTIAVLNMVENQTGISLQGLVQGFERSAGVARATGVDVRHLAAMLASLVPATGSAAQAGNALKTIFSRLISPTKETVEVLGLMGINVADLSWKSATMTDRLIVMAKKFQGLSDAQKGVVSSVAASRWQVNKFEVLMRDLLNTHGYYQRALQATARDTDVFNQMNKELTSVLTSNPRRLQIIWTMLQNAAADIITPMIPLILWLAQGIQKMVTAFSQLPQPVQTTVLALLGFLAVLGPLVRIFGAVTLMTAEVGKLFMFLLMPIRAVSGALMALVRTPVTWLLTSIGAMVRGALGSLGFLAVGTRAAMVGMGNAMVYGTRYLGIAFRSGFGVLWSAAIGLWYTLEIIFTRGLIRLQMIMVAGARALGVAWRAALAGIAAIQAAFTALMSISWGAMFLRIGAVLGAGFRGISAMFVAFLPTLRALSTAIMAAMTGPWGIAISIVVLLVLAFWDELKSILHAIVQGTMNAFNALPAGIVGAMQAVVNIVRAAVMAVYRLFSYLNPWAHHSPSLVENVTTGMDEVARQFARAKSFGNVFKSTYADMQRFGKALAKLQAIQAAGDYADMRKSISGVDPGALGSFNRLVAILPKLKTMLASLKPALDAQKAVVAGWKTKLDAANDALDKQQKILDKLNKVVDGYQNQLDAAKAKLDGFADAPIQGMKAMSDAIFQNEMQQKQLRLELMKMEDAVGPLDKLQSKIDAINGQIEMLRGQQSELRNAGAGSEILSVYDDQINMLEQQQTAIEAQMAPMKDLTNQIDELARKGEELDLENSLKFDPLKRQIDDVVNSMKELPFDEIIAGVKDNKAEVDRLTEAYNKAKAAADKQQAIVDTLTAQRDAVQERYDAESKALEKLQTQYDEYETQIRDIEQALKDAGSAADAIAQARKKAGGGAGGGGGMSPGAENFQAGAGGNFGDPGGFAQIGREGGLGDQASMIDDFTKEMAKKTADMFGIFNFLDPIKKAWNTAWNWLKTNIGPAVAGFASGFSSGLGDIKLFDGMSSWLDTAKSVGKGIMDALGFIWDFIGPEVVNLAKEAWAGLKDGFKSIQPEVEQFRKVIGPMGQAIKNIWEFSKPGMMLILGLIVAIVKGLVRGLGGAIKGLMGLFSGLVGGIIRIIRGIIEFVSGVFTGDWSLAWKGITDIFSGIWKGIWSILSGAFKTIWGLLSGFVSGFIGFFTQLYDTLVGHSIVPDMVNAIIAWIASLPMKAWNALASFAANMVNRAKEAFLKFLDMSVDGWITITSWLKTLPGKAAAAILAIVSLLGGKARDAFNAFFSYAKTGWSAIASWVSQRPSDAANRIAGIIAALRNKAVEAMNNFKTGFTNGWSAIGSWLSGRAGAIRSAIGSVNLWNIGSAIMNSLWDGLKSVWNSIANWLSSKGSEIKNLKGPIQKDRILLVNEGAAIMGGLGKGMKTEWNGVEGWLATVSGSIRQTIQASNELNRIMAYQTGTTAFQNASTLRKNDSNEGGRTINLYGNLEFPNITGPDDAEELILNLEAIIRGQ